MKLKLYMHSRAVIILALVFTNVACSTTGLFAQQEQSTLFTISTSNNNARHFVIGEEMDIILSVSEDLYLHCFYVSGDSSRKLHPAHFPRHHGIVHPTRPDFPVSISDHLGTMIAAKPVGSDTVSCIASSKPLLYKIPVNISDAELASVLPYDSMDAIFEAFRRVTSQPLHVQFIQINITEDNGTPEAHKAADN